MDDGHQFDFTHFLYTVRELFLDKFRPENDIDRHVFREITFAERQDFDKIYLKTPSLVLDIYEARMNALPGGSNHEDVSVYSNLGNFLLYIGICAKVIVSQDKIKEEVESDKELIRFYDSPLDKNKSIVIDEPSVWVRKLAFDVAAFVAQEVRFKSPVGLSQVTRIGPSNDARIGQGTLLAWEVMWQHSLDLGKVDNDEFDDPSIAAADVREIQVSSERYSEVLESRDPALLEDPPDLDTDETNPERDRKADTEVVFYKRPPENYERPPEDERLLEDG